MIGDDVTQALPELRAHAESMMIETAVVSRLAGSGWTEQARIPCRRVRPGRDTVTIPTGTTGDAFALASVHLPVTADVRLGDRVTVAGQDAIVTSAPRHTHMIELRAGGVWPATPVTVTVVRPREKDLRGNPVPGTDKTFTLADVALFAVTTSDPTDLSMVVKTSLRAWLLPGSDIATGDELLPQSPSMPFRYIVRGDPIPSPLGVVVDLQRGMVVGVD